jgi:hypothetical protein
MQNAATRVHQCFVSVLQVFCQCFASVLPVFCQCFASVFKATTQIFKLHSGVRDREGSKNMQNVNFQCLAVFCQCFASVLQVFCQCFASPPGAFFFQSVFSQCLVSV